MPIAKSSNPVGRPKQLDLNQLLNIAVEQFWRHGYQGTSLRHIASAANMTTGALYSTYKDKDALFIAALEHYINTVIKPRVDNILLTENDHSPVERIRYFLSSSVIGLPKSIAHQACLLVNSNIEFSGATANHTVHTTIRTGLKYIEKGLLHQLSRQTTTQPQSALVQIQIFMTGLLLTAKAQGQEQVLSQAIDQFIHNTFRTQQ